MLVGGSLDLDLGTSANLQDEDAIFDDLLLADRLLPVTEGSFFFADDDAVVAPARDVLARIVAALFSERVDDCNFALSLEAFDEDDTTDLESAQTETGDSTEADFIEAEDVTDLPLLSLRFSILSTFL